MIIIIILLYIAGVYTTVYDIAIVSDPPISKNGIFEFPVGSNITLTCMVTPTPPSDSEFSWICSTECFVDMEIEQSVNITELEIADSGELNCSVIIDNVEYTSEIIELRVTGMLPYKQSLVY